MPEHDQDLVATVLRALGLAPSPEDVSALADAYPELRAMVARLDLADATDQMTPDPPADLREDDE